MKAVLVLGGYGVFGSRLVRALSSDGIPVIIAGRNKTRAENLERELQRQIPQADIKIAIFDITNNINDQLKRLNPLLVINTCGPFQISDYSIATACIAAGIHYIDLADGRDFVNNITQLDESAKKNNVMVISGASTVPGLSSAVIEHFQAQFKQIDNLDYGLSPGAKTPRGLATAKSILSYVGKPLQAYPGGEKVYGWQDLHAVKYPTLGYRLMANCDVPDLELFFDKYNIKQLHFSAGMDSKLLHLGIWLLSWLVRVGIPINLMNYARPLTKLSHLFDRFGSDDGGMHVVLQGIDHQNKPLTIKWFIIVKDGDGPQVPTVPAIVLARKILAKQLDIPGAHPCCGLVSLEEYMQELKKFSSYDFVDIV